MGGNTHIIGMTFTPESAMRMLILAAITAIFAASPAMARCYTVPDNASTHYVDRSIGRTICLQDDIAATQEQKRLQTNYDTQITNLQQQIQQQKFDQMMHQNGF
jgi:hypothetical protein